MQSDKGKTGNSSSFFDTGPTDQDQEAYKKVIYEWLELHPEKKDREPDKEDVMEAIVELIQQKDERWKLIKARHRKSTCKLYKYLYDTVDHWTDVFDKNRKKIKTPPKIKQTKAASAEPEMINAYSKPETLEGFRYVRNSPDSKSSYHSFKPSKP